MNKETRIREIEQYMGDVYRILEKIQYELNKLREVYKNEFE